MRHTRTYLRGALPLAVFPHPRRSPCRMGGRGEKERKNLRQKLSTTKMPERLARPHLAVVALLSLPRSVARITKERYGPDILGHLVSRLRFAAWRPTSSSASCSLMTLKCSGLAP